MAEDYRARKCRHARTEQAEQFALRVRSCARSSIADASGEPVEMLDHRLRFGVVEIREQRVDPSLMSFGNSQKLRRAFSGQPHNNSAAVVVWRLAHHNFIRNKSV